VSLKRKEDIYKHTYNPKTDVLGKKRGRLLYLLLISIYLTTIINYNMLFPLQQYFLEGKKINNNSKDNLMLFPLQQIPK
jgi:hypothetical protein